MFGRSIISKGARAAAVAGAVLLAAVVFSFFPLGPFESLLTSPPVELRWPRAMATLSIGLVASWALRGSYRSAQRTAIVVLGALVLSHIALILAYLLAQLYPD